MRLPVYVVVLLAAGCSSSTHPPSSDDERNAEPEAPPATPAAEPETEEPERQRWVFGLANDYASEGERKRAQENALRTVRRRLHDLDIAEPIALAKGDTIVVEVPSPIDPPGPIVQQVLTRPAELSFHRVADAHPYVRRVYEHARTDPTAKRAGVEAETDTWTGPDGAQHDETYLTAGAWDVLLEYLGSLRVHFAPPAGHHWNVEPVRDAAGATTAWRSHLIETQQVLAGERVASAHVVFAPKTGRPQVRITFDAEGAKALAALTKAMVGRKLAIVFEKTVFSAPVVHAPVTGGEMSLTMGAATAVDAQRQAENLADVLRQGALPAPLEPIAEE